MCFFLVLNGSNTGGIKTKNAVQASRQGAIACITDDHCIINVESVEYWGYLILRDSNYVQREVHFIVDGILYKCKGRN